MEDTKFYYWVSVLVANVESYEANKLENIKLYESNQKKRTFCAVRALCRGCESLKNVSKTSTTFRNFQSKLLTPTHANTCPLCSRIINQNPVQCSPYYSTRYESKSSLLSECLQVMLTVIRKILSDQSLLHTLIPWSLVSSHHRKEINLDTTRFNHSEVFIYTVILSIID